MVVDGEEARLAELAVVAAEAEVASAVVAGVVTLAVIAVDLTAVAEVQEVAEAVGVAWSEAAATTTALEVHQVVALATSEGVWTEKVAVAVAVAVAVPDGVVLLDVAQVITTMQLHSTQFCSYLIVL